MNRLSLPIKQGTDFAVRLNYAIDGVPEAIVASDFNAQVRDGRDNLITTLTVQAGFATGEIYLRASAAQTAKWPVGDLFFDVRRVTGGNTTATDTVAFAVVKKVSS